MRCTGQGFAPPSTKLAGQLRGVQIKRSGELRRNLQSGCGARVSFAGASLTLELDRAGWDGLGMACSQLQARLGLGCELDRARADRQARARACVCVCTPNGCRRAWGSESLGRHTANDSGRPGERAGGRVLGGGGGGQGWWWRVGEGAGGAGATGRTRAQRRSASERAWQHVQSQFSSALQWKTRGGGVLTGCASGGVEWRARVGLRVDGCARVRGPAPEWECVYCVRR